MQGNFRKFFAWSWSACMLLVLSACGGAGGGGSTQLAVETATISGSALKGPIKGALVQVFRLNSNGTKGELLGSGSTGNDGAYAIEVPKAKALAPLLVTVTGQSGARYTSESKGSDVDFSAAESFHAALDSFEPGRKYTVGPLTEAAYQQLQKFVTDNPSLAADSRIVSAANARIATLFNVRDVLADPATDPAYSTSLRIIDRMIEDSKVSGAGNTLQTMNLMNQAFVDVTRPAYQTYRAALISAANLVKGDVASLAASVDAMLATAANPPAEPDWTDATAPQAVTELRARAGAETATTGSATLSWSAATSTGQNRVTGYQVYRNGTRIASVSSTGYLDQPLALQTGYSYYVIAFDAAGNRSLPSAQVSVSTPDAPNLAITVGGGLSPNVTALPFQDITPPSAPANLAAATTAIDAATSSVRLTWSAATDAVAVTGYEVYRDGAKVGTTAQAAYSDAAVASGVAHHYTVIAFDAAGNRSAASAPLSITPVAPNLDISIGGQLGSSITGQ